MLIKYINKNIIITILLLMLFIINNNVVIAKDINKKKEKKKKLPHNIEAIDSKFMFKPNYSSQYTRLSIISRKVLNSNSLIYKPNVFGSIGFSASIKKIKFAYSFKLNPLNKNLGETDYKNINLGIQTRIVGLNFSFLRYKGFYLKNYTDFGFSSNYIRPDINIYSVGLTADFVMTKSFSINAAFSQNERQKKSAGSFMIMVGDKYSFFDSDSSIVIKQEVNNFDRLNYVRNTKSNTLLIAPGFGYSIIYKRFNFTPILLAGIGAQFKLYNYVGFNSVSLRMPIYFLYRNALGYNGEKFFFNLIYSYDINNLKFSDSNIKLNVISWQLSVGFRIK